MSTSQRPAAGAGGWLPLLPLAALVSLSAGFCPTRCRCNDAALQADCTSSQLSSVPITLHPRLKRLQLATNNIRRLDETMLSAYTQLTYLDLADNGPLLQIEPNSFAQLAELRQLQLGDNLLKQLASDVFVGLHQLRQLDLSDNQLRKLPVGLLRPMPLLQDLKLSDNLLQQLPAGAVAGAVSLRRLSLQRNSLQQLPAAALAQLQQLNTLDLSFNSITELPDGELGRVRPTLVGLSLAGNRLKRLQGTALAGLVSLRRLVLSATDLSDMADVSLSGLQALEELYLDENLLRHLSAPASCRADGSHEQLKRLRLLSVRACAHLTSLAPDAFACYPALQELRLDGNPQLSGVPAQVFRPLPLLQRLSLRDNALTTLSADAADWKHINFLNLDGNPLLCDCPLMWLVKREGGGEGNDVSHGTSDGDSGSGSNDSMSVSANGANDGSGKGHGDDDNGDDSSQNSGATCAEPALLRGRAVSQLSPEQLGCTVGDASTLTERQLTLAVALPCAALALLVLALLGALAWRHRQRLRQRLKVVHWRDQLDVQRRSGGGAGGKRAPPPDTGVYCYRDTYRREDGDARLVPAVQL